MVSRVRLGQVDRFLAAGGFEHGVAMPFEREPREPPHGVFVLDEQHGLPADGWRRLLRRWRLRLAPLDRWQIHAERGTDAGHRLDGDEAAGLLKNAVDGGQPESRAFARSLGREERLEQMLDDIGRHARARVAHRQLQESPGLCGGCSRL